MGRVGIEPTFHGLKVRCITILLSTQIIEVVGIEPTSKPYQDFAKPLS